MTCSPFLASHNIQLQRKDFSVFPARFSGFIQSSNRAVLGYFDKGKIYYTAVDNIMKNNYF